MKRAQPRGEDISHLNDQLRRTGQGGQVLMTRGIAALSEREQALIFRAVMTFNDFTRDNDPYGEHDCATIELPDMPPVIWKVDYYAPDMEHGCEDPADPEQTVRVLTIMLASEY